MAGEHLKPEFLKMNPLHRIPTLDDDGFYLYESRAVMQYLANEYGRGDSGIYPTNPRARYLVDKMLMFDQGDLHQSFASAYYGAVFQGKKIDPADIGKLNEALQHVNSFLTETSSYIAGNNLTIADIAIVTTLSTISACGHDVTSDYPAIQRYMERLKTEIVGYKELNQQGADMFGQFVASALKK
jgi:glutathione S-transferase